LTSGTATSGTYEVSCAIPLDGDTGTWTTTISATDLDSQTTTATGASFDVLSAPIEVTLNPSVIYPFPTGIASFGWTFTSVSPIADPSYDGLFCPVPNESSSQVDDVYTTVISCEDFVSPDGYSDYIGQSVTSTISASDSNGDSVTLPGPTFMFPKGGGGILSASASPDGAIFGQPVTYSATPALLFDGNQTITFSVGDIPLCTTTSTYAPDQCTSTAAPVGTDTVTVTASGNSKITPSSSSFSMQVLPDECQLGSYSESGDEPCEEANPGYYAVYGATTETECSIGTYSPNAGDGSCIVAPVDNYVSTDGATSAIPCPVGSFTLQPGSTSESACVFLAVTTTSLSPGSVYSKANAVEYSARLAAIGGDLPYKWSLVSGSSLPPGLKLSSIGLISGKAKTVGSYTFTVKVVDTKTKTKPPTQNMATATLSITIG
jgi:hypothetical protein